MVRCYLTLMKTKMSSKGQIVLPVELRDMDEIKPGQLFSVERLGEGEYILRRVAEPGDGIAGWLLDCPARGWFEPLPSESTADL